jgi:hypothetical protein
VTSESLRALTNHYGHPAKGSILDRMLTDFSEYQLIQRETVVDGAKRGFLSRRDHSV